MTEITVNSRVQLKDQTSGFAGRVLDVWVDTLVVQIGNQPPFLSPAKYWEPVAPQSEQVPRSSPVGPPAGTASV